MLENPRMGTMIASAALDRKLRDRLVGIARGEVTGDGTTTAVAVEDEAQSAVAAPEAIATVSNEGTEGQEQAAPVE